MTWFNIIAVITKLIELEAFTVDSCGNALECKFEATGSNRYHSDALQSPFEYAELISGTDKTILLLTLHVDAAREEYAMRMLSLGKPIDIDMASPSIADGSGASTNMGWDRKYSLCYEIGDRPVWFGVEEANSKKRLVNISIHQPHNISSE
ncbi:MAG: hypothetical protein PVJ21_19275 [Anaerolineales bacterium]|jgi:hypothetical protein